MKKLLLLIVLLSPWLRAQTVSGSLTASDSGACSIANSCITLAVDQTQGAAGIALSGTFSATAQFEVSADKGVTWVAAAGTPPGSTTTATSATAAGTWRFAVSGLTHIRVRCSAYTSGTIVASIVASKQAASLGGGGPGSLSVPGSGSEFQIRLDSSTLQALSGSSISGSNAIFGGSVTGTSFITNGTAAGNIALAEQASSGTDTLTLQAPNSIAANLTFVLPGADGTNGQAICTNGGGTLSFCSVGAGTVTSFSAGNLSPLFTTSVATATSTPALTFSLSNFAAGTIFGNPTGAAAGPIATATPVLGLPGTTLGSLGFAGNTSGTATIQPQATAGSPTLTLPNTTGTLADGATTPLALSATTGNLTCSTCATTTNGGALSGTAPVAVSAAGAISITGVAGQVLAGSGPAFTATPTLGAAGVATGTLGFSGTTSGTVTVQPQAAAGTYNFNLPTTVGTAGQLLASQAGGSTAMTWVTFTAQTFFAFCSGTATSSATLSFNFYGGSFASASLCTTASFNTGDGVPIVQAGHLADLYVIARTGGSNAGSGAVTVWVDNSATTLTCTTGTGTTCNDTTHQPSVSAGSKVQLKMATSGTETLATVQISFHLIP